MGEDKKDRSSLITFVCLFLLIASSLALFLYKDGKLLKKDIQQEETVEENNHELGSYLDDAYKSIVEEANNLREKSREAFIYGDDELGKELSKLATELENIAIELVIGADKETYFEPSDYPNIKITVFMLEYMIQQNNLESGIVGFYYDANGKKHNVSGSGEFDQEQFANSTSGSILCRENKDALTFTYTIWEKDFDDIIKASEKTEGFVEFWKELESELIEDCIYYKGKAESKLVNATFIIRVVSQHDLTTTLLEIKNGEVFLNSILQ